MNNTLQELDNALELLEQGYSKDEIVQKVTPSVEVRQMLDVVFLTQTLPQIKYTNARKAVMLKRVKTSLRDRATARNRAASRWWVPAFFRNRSDWFEIDFRPILKPGISKLLEVTVAFSLLLAVVLGLLIMAQSLPQTPLIQPGVTVNVHETPTAAPTASAISKREFLPTLAQEPVTEKLNSNTAAPQVPLARNTPEIKTGGSLTTPAGSPATGKIAPTLTSQSAGRRYVPPVMTASPGVQTTPVIIIPATTNNPPATPTTTTGPIQNPVKLGDVSPGPVASKPVQPTTEPTPAASGAIPATPRPTPTEKELAEPTEKSASTGKPEIKPTQKPEPTEEDDEDEIEPTEKWESSEKEMEDFTPRPAATEKVTITPAYRHQPTPTRKSEITPTSTPHYDH